MPKRRRKNPETISIHNILQDVVKQFSVLTLLLDEDKTMSWLKDGARTAAQVGANLRKRLAGVWTKRWKKVPPKKSPELKKRHADYLKGGHSLAYRILRSEHELVAEPDLVDN